MSSPAEPEGAWLDRIVASRRQAVARSAARPAPTTVARVDRRADRQPFLAAVRSAPLGRVAVIAEIKRVSPARGSLRQELDPASLAAAYARGGAAALSVLTEPDFFGAQPDDLPRARAAAGLPTLCKDFVVDPRQLEEAAALGADAVLLLVVVLGQQTGAFVARCRALGLTPLVEVHDEAEMEIALASGAELIGINNRDLRTFTVDPATAVRLAPRAAAAGRTVAALSGIDGPQDLRGLRSVGIVAVLVGTSLVRSGDPEGAVAALVAADATGGGMAGVD